MVFWSGRRGVALALALLGMLAGATACSSARAQQSASASAEHVSARDLGWLDQAHQANLAEINAGQFAQTNASAADIRSAGAMLVRDHTALDAKLIHVAAELKVSLVTHLTVQQYEISDRLGKELGFTFDHDFTGSMMTAHQEMITATTTEIQHGSSPLVTALAQQTLPVLEKHLRMMRAVAGSG